MKRVDRPRYREGFREFREFWVLCWLYRCGFPNSTNLTLAPEDPAALKSLNTLNGSNFFIMLHVFGSSFHASFWIFDAHDAFR